MSLFPKGFKFWHLIEPDTRRLTLTQAGEMRLGDPLYMLSQQWRMGEFRHVQGSIPIRAETEIIEVPLSAKVDHEGNTKWMDAAVRGDEVFAESSGSMRLLAPERRRINLGLSAQRSVKRALIRTIKPQTDWLQTEWKEIQKRFAAKRNSGERLMRLRAKSGKIVLDGYALFLAISNRDVKLTESLLWRVLFDWFKTEGGVLRKKPLRVLDWQYQFPPNFKNIPFPKLDVWRKWPLPIPVPNIPIKDVAAAPKPDLFNPETLTHVGKVIYGSHANSIRLNVANSDDGTLNWTHFKDEVVMLDATARSDWVVPTRLSFPGKPEERLWTLADNAADWTAASAGPSDLSRMLLGALIAEQSADWMIIPLTVARGALVQIKDIHITTGFGKLRVIRAAGPDHLRLWANLSGQAADTIMTLAEPQPIEGPVLERTALRPDDHANLLWLIERRLPDRDGRGRDVEEHRAEFPETDKPVYHLQNDPGQNWYPFGHEPGHPFSPRPFVTSAGHIKIPAGQLGQSIDSIAQGLVPAEGLRVERLWRMGRNHEGRPVWWIARRRGLAGEPASSGLAYDQLVRPKRK